MKIHERVKMLVWRIGMNILPTKENLAQRLGLEDKECSLCHEEIESCTHLFFQCNVARAIWFGSMWGVRPDKVQILCNADIAKFVLYPPAVVNNENMSSKQSHEQNSLRIALTLEAIRNLRNQVCFKGEKCNIIAIITMSNHRFQEMVTVDDQIANQTPPEKILWTKPPSGTVKLNVDAACSSDSSWLAVVARDDQGSILKGWTKVFCSCEAVVAEAKAILWAVQIAKSENFQSVIIEGDAKVCFDAINGDLEKCNWTIAFQCNDMVVLSKKFESCTFCWIKRDANFVAHSLAKFASCNKLIFSCNISSLPPPVWKAWKGDGFTVSV
jgi:ribonuclease HI